AAAFDYCVHNALQFVPAYLLLLTFTRIIYPDHPEPFDSLIGPGLPSPMRRAAIVRKYPLPAQPLFLAGPGRLLPFNPLF
ncbi:MAG TPA: hypothetical protein VMH83_01065, partial [Candidatus Acidoferrum sp.]|nr:hypothetical protein [Candidatus Acidoferrum sp.]